MTNSWPPIMHAPSKDLKRCLGDEDMHIKTMWKRLRELGYKTKKGMYIDTYELIERATTMQKEQVLPNFEKYHPKSDRAKQLLE